MLYGSSVCNEVFPIFICCNDGIVKYRNGAVDAVYKIRQSEDEK